MFKEANFPAFLLLLVWRRCLYFRTQEHYFVGVYIHDVLSTSRDTKDLISSGAWQWFQMVVVTVWDCRVFNVTMILSANVTDCYSYMLCMELPTPTPSQP